MGRCREPPEDQRERLLGYLRRHRSISRQDAIEKLAIPYPDGRVKELRDAGELLYTVRHTGTDGRVEVRYCLKG